MGPMPSDDARQIRQRFESVMERMGRAVRLMDQRRQPAESVHRGYLTKGSGAEAAWEFRFLEAPDGLQEGSLLSLDGEAERWRVQRIHREQDGDEVLFVSAQVASLEAPEVPTAEDLAGHLAGLQETLLRSTLGPLDQDDVAEALARLPRLLAAGPDPTAAARIKQRLKLLSDRFKACPQTAHEAKGRVLKLEAHLKRKGHL